MVVFQTLVVLRADFSEICCLSESSSNLLPIWPNSSIDGCFFGGWGDSSSFGGLHQIKVLFHVWTQVLHTLVSH